MTPNDKIIGFIRTYVPYGISAGLAWLLLTTGFDLTGEVQVALVTLTVALVTNVYYMAIRLIEARVPWIGALLGWPKSPGYIAVDGLWASLVRTLVPTLAAFVVVTLSFWIAEAFGAQIDVSTQAGFIVIVVGLFEIAYYAVARAILDRWPNMAWLLGVPRDPIGLASDAPRYA